MDPLLSSARVTRLEDRRETRRYASRTARARAERGSNLSGGFAQSVALARVFLRRSAQIVILDESMGQMDALKKRELIFPRLFAFVKEQRMTLIIISHEVGSGRGARAPGRSISGLHGSARLASPRIPVCPLILRCLVSLV